MIHKILSNFINVIPELILESSLLPEDRNLITRIVDYQDPQGDPLDIWLIPVCSADLAAVPEHLPPRVSPDLKPG